jgi:hypothetical protein
LVLALSGGEAESGAPLRGDEASAARIADDA